MNALFGTVIKVFLALVKTDDAVGQDDGDGTDWGDGGVGEMGSVVHGGLYRPTPVIFSGG